MQNKIYHCGPIACDIDAMPLLNWESGIISTAGSGTTHVISIVGSRPTRPERNPLRPLRVVSSLSRASTRSRSQVWTGSGLPTTERGIRVLGTQFRHNVFVLVHLDRVLDSHQTLLQRIPVGSRCPVGVGTPKKSHTSIVCGRLGILRPCLAIW